MSLDVPRRTFAVDITIGGDTWEDVVRELRRFTDHVEEHGPDCSMSSGGPTVGGWVHVTHDPAMTHDLYFKAIEQWRVARSEEKG